MKRILAIAMAAGFALSASADVLEEWTYNETTAGLRIDQVANTGTVGTSWNYGDPTKWATDGAGGLSVFSGTGLGADYKTSQNFAGGALSVNDIYTMEIKIGAWNMPVGAGDSQVKWRLATSASSSPVLSIQTTMTASGLGFTLTSGGTNYRGHNAGGMTGTGASAKIEFNPVVGSATYYVNDVEKETFTGLDLGSIEKFVMNKEGSWSDVGKVLTIDEQSLSVIPEPATLGLVAFVGGGLLFIRRRFMI